MAGPQNRFQAAQRTGCVRTRTLEAMDRVRFGRALGYGARHAAKTLAEVVEAAASPDPRPRVPPPSAARTRRSEASVSAVQATETLRSAGRNAKTQAKRSFFGPIARFSKVLWLQVTGTFFALIALTMAGAAWRARAAWHEPASSHPAIKLYVYLTVCAFFAYFAITSFVRAERR